jgi:hypothetical protein
VGDILLHGGLYREGVFAMALNYSFKNTNSDGIIFNQHLVIAFTLFLFFLMEGMTNCDKGMLCDM